MLSLSLQPLLDNVERVGLGPALRILRAVAHMTQQTVDGQALELEWVRSNTWQLDDTDYLAMVELKTSWYSFITPLQVGAIAAGGAPEWLAPLESLGRHLGAAFQITDDLLNLRADPEDYGKEIGGDLWEGKRTLMVLHTLRCAEPGDRDRAVQILARRRPSVDSELGLAALLDQLVARGELSRAGQSEIAARLRDTTPRSRRTSTTSVGSTTCCTASVRRSTLGRSPAGMPARPRPCWRVLTGSRRANIGMCCAASSTTCMSVPDEPRGPDRHARRAGADQGTDP